MKSKALLFSAATLLFAAFAASVSLAGPKFTDPEKTDADFTVQGEYFGEVETPDGKAVFGVQVIALGGGKFRSVGYHGGLPGKGWNGESPVQVESERSKDGTVTFKDKHGSGTIKDGVLHIDLGADGKVDGKIERIVRVSPTLGQKPPAGAVELFSGKQSLENWPGAKVTEDGLLMPPATSKKKFRSHKLHIEFLLPYQPEDRGQGRGNSGIYVQGRYEVQMLDSFGLKGKNNECGGIYSVKDPDVNMCFPPLTWQTYDIEYTAAKYEGEKLIANPRMTVRHNGVLVHDNVELPGERSTTAAPSRPGPSPGPVFVQNHGCPVRYRNIWVVEEK